MGEIFSGVSGTMTIGGKTIPIESWSTRIDDEAKVNEAGFFGDAWCAAEAHARQFNGTFEVTWTLTWDTNPAWRDLQERWWYGFLYASFVRAPGFRFADIMRGVERN